MNVAKIVHSTIMKQIKLGRNIYPDIELSEVDKFLFQYGIKMGFLFDDGVEFFIPDHIMTKNYPGDLSFYREGFNNPDLIFVISFGELLFLDGGYRKKLFKIPIYD